mmetsp:Transcript_21304/g.37869  ORF Transcript_21304/g.37869 Transcript_21304/m.37869 type:complete len:112 (-) Transcript_21304:177-512(-)|eukprot:CAMPEP_0197525786 /NCGR_PEP_ID=MMETSP1318-20131121/14476_1 /TAXON_ID=552666 /ORGANISM="Partenskyella glossopodia, Strain RCC365" /LENGTH=111 /DNA_ID=CAMNT_0043079535 /DNA_START=497 /DNA_END=832 /DNA_ORIENTATION=-
MVLAFTPGLFYLILALTCQKLYTDGDEEVGRKSMKDPLLDPVEDGLIDDSKLLSENKIVHDAIQDAVVDAVIGAAKDKLLPANWVARDDAGSGSQYYVNTATGETSWDRPE